MKICPFKINSLENQPEHFNLTDNQLFNLTVNIWPIEIYSSEDQPEHLNLPDNQPDFMVWLNCENKPYQT